MVMQRAVLGAQQTETEGVNGPWGALSGKDATAEGEEELGVCVHVWVCVCRHAGFYPGQEAPLVSGCLGGAGRSQRSWGMGHSGRDWGNGVSEQGPSPTRPSRFIWIFS